MTTPNRPKKFRRLMRLALSVLAIVYLVMLVGCSIFQRALLYYPTHDDPAVMDHAAQSAGFERWKNAAGQAIGWKRLSSARPARGELLIIHGNGGSAIHRVDYARPLREAAPMDVYILEYPGYGDRPGKPGEKALCDAAEEALASMPKKAPVYLLGESLGTAVATYLAGRHNADIAGLVLFAPYHNLDDVAQYHFRFLPARWLMHDHFRSGEYLRGYHGPVAVVVAGHDEVIPAKFGRRLFDGYDGPKRLWEFPNAGHNTLLPETSEFWTEVETFWKSSRQR